MGFLSPKQIRKDISRYVQTGGFFAVLLPLGAFVIHPMVNYITAAPTTAASTTGSYSVKKRLSHFVERKQIYKFINLKTL